MANANPDFDSIFGDGVSYPLEFDPVARTVKRKAGLSHVAQSIFIIVTTALGSYVMRGWFGCNLGRYVDSPINRSNLAAMRLEIFNALSEETRGEITKVTMENPEPWQLLITIYFRIDHEVTIAVKMLYDRDMSRWELQP